jgi:P4 family phage/plasmid primase-like protien
MTNDENFSTPPDDPSSRPPVKEPSEWDYANQLEKNLPPIRTVGDPIFHGAIAFARDGGILINVLNGIVAMYSDKVTLRPHDAGLYFTRAINVVYDPSATSPLFDRTLKESLPDQLDQELLDLCFGNFLLPDCRFEVALVCYGEAGSGKSTIARPVTELFGVSSYGLLTRLSMGQICDPNCYSLAKLRYACVNLGTELHSIAVDESANFKTIVSGEPLEARSIYCSPFTMHTHCKLWFLANDLPRFKNGTEAELRRTRFLRFEYKPDKPDVLLKERVALEAPGVFNRMLRGLQRALTVDRIPLGGAHSQSVHNRFQVSNDPLGTFLTRFCILSPHHEAPKDNLFNAFSAYCDQYGLPHNLAEQFFRRLYERFPDVKETRRRDATSPTGRRHAITGIALIPEATSSLMSEVVGGGDVATTPSTTGQTTGQPASPLLKSISFDLSNTSIS